MTTALAPAADDRLTPAAPAADDRLQWRDGFLRPDECGAILQELEFAYWSRSKVYVETGEGGYRHILGDKRDSMTTSERWFSVPLRRAIAAIDRRLARRLPQVLTHREEWQATRYRKGGRFGYHADSGYFAGEPAGERTHTILIYLEAPRRGGVTRFPHLDIDVRSVAGRLAIWTNLTADGRGDPEMVHAGMPVSEGRKTTLVTWVRERECSKASWRPRP
jgi:prolyl 4-hydroxylase